MSNLSKIEEIYHAALEKDPSEREDFLRESCGGDENLRREVDSLLSFDAEAAEFIETPPGGLAADFIVKHKEKGDLIRRKFGHYRILSQIGAGGMGEVYLAEDTRLERRVALKILPPEFAEDKDRMNRFVREAKSASALNHPNIITIYEIGETDSTRFIAAEYIEGETISRRLEREPPDLETTLDVAIQIASALDAAHRAGILHRDIKPDNIMIRPDGLVKILDFGIAKFSTDSGFGNSDFGFQSQESESLRKSGDKNPKSPIQNHKSTATGTIIGTATYMSPEQAKGKKIDARSDIFSFGIVFYEMLTGRRAFDGETPLEVISSILKDDPVPICQILPEIPPEIELVVGKMLRKDRDERYQTTRELCADLKTLRRELDLRDTAERSAARAARKDEKTQIGNVHGTNSERERQTSGGQFVTAEFKKHKFGLAAISLILIALLGGGWFYYNQASGGSGAIDSIAVLPFENASGEGDDEFLSDGIAETLINNFTKIPDLRVTARSTAFRFRGRDSEPQAIGRELGVGVILTGKVWQIGDDLSIQVDLVNASDETQIFGDRYDGKVADILGLQQKIVRDVTGHLRLTGAQQQQAAKKDTEISEAYKFYLRGRYHWNKRTAEDLRKAIREFKKAADLDPKYALAFVGLADCYLLLEEYSGASASETLPQARAFAAHALEIDESLGEAHVSLGVITSQMWQYSKAEYHFKRAIELNPKYSTAYLWFCTYLRDTGRFDEALAVIKQAQQLDPLSSIINVNVGLMHLVKNDADSATKELEKVIELDPNYWLAHTSLGLAYLKQGRRNEALAVMEKGVELSRRSNRAIAFLGYAKAVTGNRSEAAAIIKELEEKYARREATILNIAMVYAGLGDNDQAFAWLEKTLESRSGESGRVRWYPPLESLRGDARYTSLIRRMGQQP